MTVNEIKTQSWGKRLCLPVLCVFTTVRGQCNPEGVGEKTARNCGKEKKNDLSEDPLKEKSLNVSGNQPIASGARGAH